MSSEITEWIAYISSASITIPLAVYLFKVKIFPRENHVIGMLVVASATLELLCYFPFQEEVYHSNLYSIYNSLSFAIISLYYWKVIFEFENRRYFYSGLAVYCCSLSYILILEDVHVYKGEMHAITSAILFYFGIVYNNYQFERPPLFDKNLYSKLIFNGTIMFYFGFDFILFLILNYVLAELTLDMERLAESFYNFNNIVKDIAVAFGFYYTGRRRLNLTDDEIYRIQWRHLG